MHRFSRESTELFCYYSMQFNTLVAVMNDGTTMIKRGRTWKLKSRKKPEVSLEDWVARKLEMKAKLPAWALKVKAIPSLKALEKWSNEGYCMTPDGYKVEPDGESPNGVPSWARIMGYL